MGGSESLLLEEGERDGGQGKIAQVRARAASGERTVSVANGGGGGEGKPGQVCFSEPKSPIFLSFEEELL